MSFWKKFWQSLRDFFNLPIKVELTEFQRNKLLHEFHTYYDVNGDGRIQWKDMDLAHQNMCKLNGWRTSSSEAVFILDLFKEIWRSIQDTGDENLDGEISAHEWLCMWTIIIKNIYEARRKNRKKKKPQAQSESTASTPESEVRTDLEMMLECSEIPTWVDKYLTYKFNLFDRTGDGEIDKDEFEYVLSSGYNISVKDCRKAFTIISENGERHLTKNYFRQLTLEYFTTEDPSALGNYVNGRLIYD